ncbi:hypothetical protein [Pseudoalteromonas sp. MMG005]|uniref:hypothetical protein n=1 Tax=Pseudoalteromonas sp. MMG005 TaxID=2822682 RepID=UPI001B3A6C13|nr:hypothetical protein [Pseudoalteromonas sp. MMG005]MBQ4845322.1 hypothetical protein [Pseudoalteromonas sp. MMG005]
MTDIENRVRLLSMSGAMFVHVHGEIQKKVNTNWPVQYSFDIKQFNPQLRHAEQHDHDSALST